MLRTLARTTVILVVSAATAGALYLAVTGGEPRAAEPRLGQRDSAAVEDRLGPGRSGWDHRSRSRPDGRAPSRGEHGHGEDASLGRGIAGMAGTALQIGLVGGVVVSLQKRARGRQRRRGRE